MKKFSFYLIIALMLTALLCGCGAYNDGMVTDYPKATSSITTAPSAIPTEMPDEYSDATATPGRNGPEATESPAMQSASPTEKNSK